MRCVNIDWLEVFAIEEGDLDANYFKSAGLQVKSREYGTPQYREMFTILSKDGQPFVEIRRSPYSLKSQGGIFDEHACHIRLSNRTCYEKSPVDELRKFMLEFGYKLQSISRIDICLDCLSFDDGKDPGMFLAKYAQGNYFKEHLSKIAPHGVEVVGCDFSGHGIDGPYMREYSSWKWGAPSSAISVKLYNKTKELEEVGEKSYIRESWLQARLISHEDFLIMADIRDARYYIAQLSRNIKKAKDEKLKALKERLKDERERLRILKKRSKTIWRIEFSIKSDIKGFISSDPLDLDRKGNRRIYPLKLSTIDNRGKCEILFQTLAERYFHFKEVTYTRNGTRQRKDRCPDYWPIHYDPKKPMYIPKRVVSKPQPSRMDKIIINKLRRIIDENNEFNQLSPRIVSSIIDTLMYFRDLYHFDELNKVVDKAIMYIPRDIKEDSRVKEELSNELIKILRKIDDLNNIHNV